MKPIIVLVIIALLIYVCTYWLPMKAQKKVEPNNTDKPNMEHVGDDDTGDDDKSSETNNDTLVDARPDELDLPESPPQYVNAESAGEGSYQNIPENQFNSSHVLQSSFQADDASKYVYNGMSNIEQNEMFAMKSVGSSKARSITDDFNLKYLHSLKQ